MEGLSPTSPQQAAGIRIEPPHHSHALTAVDALELVEQGGNARKTLKDVSESMGESLIREGFPVFGNALKEVV
jgi:hypothetical protein